VVSLDRSQVLVLGGGAIFHLKKTAPSCQTLKKTNHSGISFGSHLQNAEYQPQIILIFDPSVRS
jgi:hypothetical protein